MAVVKTACIVTVQGEPVVLRAGDEVPKGVVISNPDVVDLKKSPQKKASK